MAVILILLGVSITIATCFLFAFLWSVKDGQMDDDYAAGRRILFDE